MSGDGKNGSHRWTVKGIGVVGRLTVRVQNPVIGHQVSGVTCNFKFSFCGCCGCNVQDDVRTSLRQALRLSQGFTDSRGSTPPAGTTNIPLPLVFTKCSETQPASAASSAQCPMRPRCPLFLHSDDRCPVPLTFFQSQFNNLHADRLAVALLPIHKCQRVHLVDDFQLSVCDDIAVFAATECRSVCESHHANRVRQDSLPQGDRRSALLLTCSDPFAAKTAETSSTKGTVRKTHGWHS